MAAKLEGGAYLSSFVDAISKKLSSLLKHGAVLKSTRELLKRLDVCLYDVEPVLDDAELKQFHNERVKDWLLDLQDALYMADDLVDELSTKAATATPQDPGNSNDCPQYVDSTIEDSGANHIEKIVGTLESVVGEKKNLRLKENAKVDFPPWRIPSTSLVVSSDIFGRDQDKENIIKLLLEDTSCDVELPVTGIHISSFVDAISKKLCSVPEGNDHALKLLFRRLDDCLLDVEPVLHDAELKQFHNERVKKWLVDLQDALHSADNFLDELSTKAATAPPRDQGNSYDWSSTVDSIIYGSSVDEMEKIVGTLEYHVGRKDRLLKDRLSSDKLLSDDTCAAESPVTVIPIVGMGGIGKTTLAQLVYNDANVKRIFDTRAWVCVAENPEPINVTKAIIEAIDSCPCNLDQFDSLQTNLKQKLSGKTFLVVLDDVWNHEQDKWEEFLKPFQYGKNGSKILLTTRIAKVASVFTANNLHYRLNFLSEKDCWSVFLKHSSLSIESKEYAILGPIGRKIVEKCKGLPLAVKTLGGLLRNKYYVGDWENILESEIWELSEDKSKIVPALRVSYHYLPSHLKRCFVYCSLFPKDYEFDKGELILLWMAEDLLQPKKNITPENIGCAYFDELVARSFFQPSSANEKLFVMHDIVHDLASFYGEKFFCKLEKVIDKKKIDNKTRHLLYAVKYGDTVALYEEPYNEAICMRTCLDFFKARKDIVIHLESECWPLQQQLRYLRVFSLQLACMGSLPNSIGESIHLRYLNLSFTNIVTLSESICKLYNLQTLKLEGCDELEMLPNRMQDLVNLRHLNIRGCDRLKEMPKEMSKLKHLNVLSDYIIGEHEENGIGELGTLDNLHGSFSISNLEKVKNSDEAVKAKMGNKKHIDTFKLKWLPDGDVDDVQAERDILDKLQPHQNLKELSIEGYRGETFPDWLGLSGYSKMTKLTLNSCWNCCELPALGQLPSLQHLELSRLHELKKIDFEIYNKNNAPAFKSLETLKFEKLFSWREWHFPDEFDGFPRLRILEIRHCSELSGDMPAHLPALEELTIFECENLTCPLPRAPKLHQLLVKSDNRRHTNVKAHTAIISDSNLVNSLLKSLPHVQTSRFQGLEIRKCSSLDSISPDYLPASLQYLEIFHCSSLRLSEQLQHKSLTRIYVYDCSSLKLFSLGDLPNLKGLAFGKCPHLENVVVSQALPSLRSLSFSSCDVLASLPGLGFAAPNLEKLDLYDCKEIDCFAEECLPPSLNTLEVQRCMKLARWIASNGLQSEGLTHLKLGDCSDVKSFPREGLLPASLESLDFWYFPDLETLDCKGLHHLTSLKELSISDCLNLENITDANSLSSIANICIGEKCPLRTKLEEMEDPRIQFITVADKYRYFRV